MSFETILIFILFAVGLLLLMFITTVVVFAVLGRKWIARNLKPNPYEIHRDLERLRRLNPNADINELASRLISKNALILGVIGAVTGMGGIFFSLVGMPLDLSVSTLRQMKMVHIITALYGNDDLDPDTLELRYMTLVLGGSGITSIASKFITRILTKTVGTSIPLLGSIVGFGFNWIITKSIGEAAIAWNRGETIREHSVLRIQQFKKSFTTKLEDNLITPRISERSEVLY